MSMNTRDPGAVVLHCRRCGAQITAENINLANALAKCRQCHVVFSFADQLPGAGARPKPRPGARPKPRPPISNMPLPEGLSISEHLDRLRLVRRWYGFSLFFPLLVCIVWNALMVHWYRDMATYRSAEGMELLALGAATAAGLACTYATLAGIINRTIIEASTTHLTIRHRPMPWPGNRTVPVSELEQLFCQEHVTQLSGPPFLDAAPADRTRTRDRHRASPDTTYSLNAVLRNGRRIILVKGLFEAKQALFLEDALERYLCIVNRPVAGELRS